MTNFTPARELLKAKGLDGILFSSPSHIMYLTGYAGFSHNERDAYLLITAKKVYLFTNPLYIVDLKKESKELTIVEHVAKHPFVDNLKSIVEKDKLIEIGFENDDISVNEYLRITAQITSHLIAIDLTSLRNKKTISEISTISKACQLADKAFKATRKEIRAGMTEQEIASLFEINVIKRGATLSFPTIVAFDQNAAAPHHHSNQTKLKTKDLIMIDFGVRVDNYCSDCTRTFFIGAPSKEQKKAYEDVLISQGMVVDFIKQLLKDNKPILAAEVDAIAREYLIGNNHPPLPHALGHGIGIDVHEAPKISPLSEEELTNGVVFSIEPGVYIPGKFGIRIEDLYAIQNGKLVQLTPPSIA